jgi:hypothetical protein
MSLAGPNSSPEEQRLEVLLSSYEKNLRTEVFFIRQKDMASLLELLPQQDDLIRAIGALFQSITLLPPQETLLRKRLAAADALREGNRFELDRAMQAVRDELEEMNAARIRIRQVRQISKSIYQEKPTSLLQDWA